MSDEDRDEVEVGGRRPSASVDGLKARERAEIRAMSVEERIALALEIGQRDALLRAMFAPKERR